MGSWVRSITSPFRKSCIFLHQHDDPRHHQHQHQHRQQQQRREEKSKPGVKNHQATMDLQSEVMACAYEDVQVMWSMLDKSKPAISS